MRANRSAAARGAADAGAGAPRRRQQGFAWIPEDDFVNHFAADVDPAKATVMYAVQQPLQSTFEDVMGVPAWKSLPSWYLVADDDQAIPPDAERMFAERMGATTIEVPSSHVAMVSHPDEAVELIETAVASARPGVAPARLPDRAA